MFEKLYKAKSKNILGKYRCAFIFWVLFMIVSCKSPEQLSFLLRIVLYVKKRMRGNGRNWKYMHSQNMKQTTISSKCWEFHIKLRNFQCYGLMQVSHERQNVYVDCIRYQYVQSLKTIVAPLKNWLLREYNYNTGRNFRIFSETSKNFRFWC